RLNARRSSATPLTSAIVEGAGRERASSFIGKTLRFSGKVLTGRIKSHPARTDFTLCLPGSPKVNAGGACGAWLPGRKQLRISASTTASGEKRPLLPGGHTPDPTSPRRHICQTSQKLCG